MAEQVQTGGVMRFRYERKQAEPELDPDDKREIRAAYGAYYERKRKEKRNKIVFWIILCLILLFLIGFALIKFT